jgi:hypothetical protein
MVEKAAFLTALPLLSMRNEPGRKQVMNTKNVPFLMEALARYDDFPTLPQGD